ncbi:MAG: DUF4386 domain-containing protein [Candidatus Methanoperedens sp.]|nr:DUF4386 domain-containing protein [Candidatus Methanoperedens sp.]
MTNNNADASLSRIARIAGLLFLFTFLFSTITWTFVSSRFIVEGNAIAAADSIIANESLFRISIITDLIRSAAAIVFALALYIILKSVNKNLALLAVFLKMTEAILVAVIALGHFIALLILNQRASLTVFGPEQIQALVGSFINTSFDASAIGMLFHGLNLMIFSYLIFKSRYVPGMLAGFGIISYALVFIYALITILAPDYVILPIQIICLLPSILTELILGSWLLFKGINIRQGDR